MARWWAKSALVLAAAAAPVVAAAAVGQGCGGSSVVVEDAGSDSKADADAAPKPTTTVLHPDAPPLPGESECTVEITTGIPIDPAVHIPVCSPMEYATNPPSGGDHWGVWAAYGYYDIPVPREMYVHNMEHGAVILLHNCEGDCPDVLDAFEAARVAVSGDEKCLTIPGGPTERIIITPDPLLDVPLAAASWGATYKATCVDEKSLISFVKKHYAHGTENTCANGVAYGNPDAGSPNCDPIFDGGTDGSGGTGGTGAGGTGGTGATGAGGAGGNTKTNSGMGP